MSKPKAPRSPAYPAFSASYVLIADWQDTSRWCAAILISSNTLAGT